MFWIAAPFHVATVIVVFTVVMPVSTMATMMFAVAPGLMSHAFGMSSACRFHWRGPKPVSFGVESWCRR